MNFLDTDVVRVIEEVLPARFGGGPADYQLVESEDGNGRPRMTLLVDPAVGPFDPKAVVDTFLTAISQGSGAERVMSVYWVQTDVLRVERRTPVTTSSGKILHLHLDRRSDTRSTD